MGKISSFEEFRKKASELTEDDLQPQQTLDVRPADEVGHGDEHQYYMFFKNLSAIKHYIGEIEQMDPEHLDHLLRAGHDWAADHISTSKDDIQEVAEWVRSEMEGAGQPTQEEPQNIMVNIEGDDDKVEVETETGEEEEGKEEEEEEGEDE